MVLAADECLWGHGVATLGGRACRWGAAERALTSPDFCVIWFAGHRFSEAWPERPAPLALTQNHPASLRHRVPSSRIPRWRRCPVAPSCAAAWPLAALSPGTPLSPENGSGSALAGSKAASLSVTYSGLKGNARGIYWLSHLVDHLSPVWGFLPISEALMLLPSPAPLQSDGVDPHGSDLRVSRSHTVGLETHLSSAAPRRRQSELGGLSPAVTFLLWDCAF